MQPSRSRRYLLAGYTVEHRARGWYVGRLIHPPKNLHRPLFAWVTPMIARQLRKKVERRDFPNGAD